MTSVIIESRFCGPKTSGNGGYAAGLFAQAVDGPAAVMLKSPPPLGQNITLRPVGDRKFEAVLNDQTVAFIEPAAVEIHPPLIPDDADITAARENFLEDAGGTHLLPYCFVCGNKREAGDGLRLFTGPAPDSPVNADFWTPHEGLCAPDGRVAPEFIWAALDCPGAFALRNGLNLCLLGRFAVDIYRRPSAGEKLIVAAWRTGREGRKHYSDSALYDENRNLIAAAKATWIELNDPAFLERLKRENA